MFKKISVFLYLPLLQIVSDFAVLSGTFLGYLKYLTKTNYLNLIRNNLFLITIIIIYTVSLLCVIKSGIPSPNHPFAYQMDEWHQSQSVRNVFKYGTPNLTGSANGTMFNFFITGIVLIPFYLLKIINPFAIKSAVDALSEQETLFIILRLTTLIFGILSLVYFSKISKLLKMNNKISTVFFVFTPVWLTLSNFFKYDIALVFWIILSFYYFVKYYEKQNTKDFILGSITSGFAFGVKVTGITMLPVLLLAFFLLTQNPLKNIKNLVLGVFTFVFVSVFFALPDIIFAGKSMLQYVYENTILIQEVSKNYIIKTSLPEYLFLHTLPEIFGHLFFFFSIISFLIYLFYIFKDSIQEGIHSQRLKIFIILSFLVFVLSLSTLNIFLSGNRAIVILPFLAIFSAGAFERLWKYKKNLFRIGLIITFVLFISIQILESYIWLYIKISTPQQVASEWIVKNLPKKSSLGIENIPVYQFVPDIILKEFYLMQYKKDFDSTFNYSIVNSESVSLPKYVVVSNDIYEKKYLRKSEKNDLVKRLKAEGYKRIALFPLTLPFYKYLDNNFYYPYVALYAYPEEISIYKK